MSNATSSNLPSNNLAPPVEGEVLSEEEYVREVSDKLASEMIGKLLDDIKEIERRVISRPDSAVDITAGVGVVLNLLLAVALVVSLFMVL